jgi:hypothetical protein
LPENDTGFGAIVSYRGPVNLHRRSDHEGEDDGQGRRQQPQPQPEIPALKPEGVKLAL